MPPTAGSSTAEPVEVVDATAPTADAVFYYDLASPAGYLIAERIRAELPVVCEWEPVHGAALGLPVVGWSDGELAAVAATVDSLGLLALRLPAERPPDSALAMRVATYAKGAGKSIAFSLAAFRQAYAAGRDLAEEETVLLAAAACEMHPAAVLKGAGLRTTAAALTRAGERATADGVHALPALTLGSETVCGADALDAAVQRLSAR